MTKLLLAVSLLMSSLAFAGMARAEEQRVPVTTTASAETTKSDAPPKTDAPKKASGRKASPPPK